ATLPDAQGNIIASYDHNGEVMQRSSAFANIFALPIIALAVLLLLNMLPHIAVYKRNIERFYQQFYGFKFFVVLFIFAIYLITLFPALGFKGNTTNLYIVVLAALFFYMGHVFKHLHRNY